MRPSQYSFLCLLPIFLVTLAGCQSAPSPEQEAADKAAAEAKLKEMLATKERHSAFAEKQRKLEAERRAQREAEAYRPRYAPQQLAKAAKPRTWGAITVPDLNVKAVFNSTWTNGNLNYRVALLGQQHAIDTYLESHSRHIVKLADQGGNNIFEFDLPAQDFNWSNANASYGIPTKEVRGSVPCELPNYELSVQWNLVWEN